MTKINVIVNQDKEVKIPQFEDLTIGQYFKVIDDFYEYDEVVPHLYVKLPLVRGNEEGPNISLNSSSSPKFYNCFNITKNKLEEMRDEAYCELIDNVEIRI